MHFGLDRGQPGIATVTGESVKRSGYSKWHLQRMFKKETGHH